MKIIMILSVLMLFGTFGIFLNDGYKTFKQKKYFKTFLYTILCLISLTVSGVGIWAIIQYT